MAEKPRGEDPQAWKMPEDEGIEANQEREDGSQENLDAEQALSEVAAEFAVDAEGKNPEDVAEEIQKKADEDPGLLTKLGRNKLVKRLVLVAGMSSLGMGLAERVSAKEGDPQKTEQVSEKKEWKAEGLAQFIVGLKEEAQKRGMDETQLKEYGEWIPVAVSYMKDNGYDQSFVESFLRNDLEKRFELTEEQKHLMKEMQQMANQKMEQASEKYPEVADSTLNRFQERAWNAADQAARKTNGMAVFEAEADAIYQEEFAEQIATERAMNKEMTLKGYQQEANDLAEKASIRFGENVTIEEVNAFQEDAWKFAGFVVEQGGTDASFESGLQNLFEEHFKTQIAQERTEKREALNEYLEKGEYDEMPNIDSISDTWLQENSGKIFQRDGKFYVVESAVSQDMHTAAGKADMKATSLVARLIADLNNRLEQSSAQEGNTRTSQEVISEVLRGNGKPVLERTVAEGSKYQRLVVYEVSVQ